MPGADPDGNFALRLTLGSKPAEPATKVHICRTHRRRSAGACRPIDLAADDAAEFAGEFFRPAYRLPDRFKGITSQFAELARVATFFFLSLLAGDHRE